MKKLLFPLSFFLLFALLSCTNTEERITNKTFPVIHELQPQLCKINEVIKPVDMVVLDDFLVVQNEFTPGEKCFFVYSLDSLNFLYSFAHIGRGPEDFIAPALVQNGRDNNLTVFDQASFKLIKYELGRESAHIKEKNRIAMEDKRPWQEIYYRNDSILLYSTLSNQIQSYNLKSNTVSDTLAFSSNLKDLMGDRYNPSFEGFHFSYMDNRIVVGFNFLNKITMGSVTEDGKINVTENQLEFPEALKASLYDNRYYYLYTLMTSDFVFAQYVGYLFREMQPFPLNIGRRRFDMLLEVYDSQRNPICMIDLKHDFLRCKADEKRKKLYTWSMLEDFDYLMVYDYSVVKK